MNKPFVPFDKFERECMPDGKPLHETMQENCNDRLAPPVEPCSNPCVPYWQPTGERRCLDIGVIEIEEADGCGHTRFTRIADPVIWEDSNETQCDESRNRIQKQQVNQCGGTRWVTTTELCCTPNWVPSEEGFDCSQSMERRYEEDGCGNTRLIPTGHPVNWVGTGEVRCEPGDIYQIEQINQCGDVRWFTVPGGCPCIPDWQPSGPERCTGEFVEIQQVDGCGHTRWQPTAVAVIWTNTGETRCNGGLVQNEQISQCGTTRWFTTETPCTNSPQPNELGERLFNEEFSGNRYTYLQLRLSASDGSISWHQHDLPITSEAWVTGAFDRNDYEVRITIDDTNSYGAFRTVTGSIRNVWHDLSDVTNVDVIFTIDRPYSSEESGWNNLIVRYDIRKKNEGISGGVTFGPMYINA